eukprot:CAMPEP_0113910250 /NCGR_PEP_ID=MMETSP0780_2-20120614/27407_1 /TAXON_ID=652834 /ORGANISM="Palpitomonas bilix" /LENGTH=627 /DNA_ID=CAMNT_0000906357 /DNA_START=60 /DNA_END=1940 /DNA_ORIENTATION=+ /assembly_acc=CAM_ASM_000599
MASYLPPPLWAQPAIPSLQSSCIDAVASLVTSGLLKEELLFPPVIAQKVLDRVLVQAGKSAKVQHLYPFDGEDIVAFSNVIGDDNDKDNVTIDMTPAWMFHISRHSQLERLTIARSKKNLHPSSFPCLCRFGSLTHLDLHSSASVCADMFRSFPSLQHLRDLRLGGCTQVDDEAMSVIGQKVSILECLDLSFTSVSSAGLFFITHVQPTLVELLLFATGVDEDGCHFIADCTELEVLDISCTNVPSCYFSSFPPSLRELRARDMPEFAHAQLGGADSSLPAGICAAVLDGNVHLSDDSLFEMISSSKCELQRLSVARCSMLMEEGKALLAAATTLRELELGECSVGMPVLGTMKGEMKGLTRITFHSMSIDVRIVSSLPSSVVHLAFDRCVFQSPSCLSLLARLHVSSVDFSHSSVGDEHIECLVEAFKNAAEVGRGGESTVESEKGDCCGMKLEDIKLCHTLVTNTAIAYLLEVEVDVPLRVDVSGTAVSHSFLLAHKGKAVRDGAYLVKGMLVTSLHFPPLTRRRDRSSSIPLSTPPSSFSQVVAHMLGEEEEEEKGGRVEMSRDVEEECIKYTKEDLLLVARKCSAERSTTRLRLPFLPSVVCECSRDTAEERERAALSCSWQG